MPYFLFEYFFHTTVINFRRQVEYVKCYTSVGGFPVTVSSSYLKNVTWFLKIYKNSNFIRTFYFAYSKFKYNNGQKLYAETDSSGAVQKHFETGFFVLQNQSCTIDDLEDDFIDATQVWDCRSEN